VDELVHGTGVGAGSGAGDVGLALSRSRHPELYTLLAPHLARYDKKMQVATEVGSMELMKVLTS
jgi:hypothetical protein